MLRLALSLRKASPQPSPNNNNAIASIRSTNVLWTNARSREWLLSSNSRGGFVRKYSDVPDKYEAFQDGKYRLIPREQIPKVVDDPDEVFTSLDQIKKGAILQDFGDLAQLVALYEQENAEELIQNAFAELQKRNPESYGKMTFEEFEKKVDEGALRRMQGIEALTAEVGEPSDEDAKSAPLLFSNVEKNLERFKRDPSIYSPESQEIFREIESVLHDIKGPTHRITKLEPYSGEDYPAYLRGDFGTREKPVIVPSFYPTRIVGCTGDYEKSEHAVLWHIVNESRPTVCLECGQFFKLKKLDENLLKDEVTNKGDNDVEYLI